MTSPKNLSSDHLLSHANFIRGLARSLVADESCAEDLVQQTWLAALEHPPRKTDGLAAWLRTVCRNFSNRRGREEGRRRRREEFAARTEAVAPTSDTLAHEQTMRAVMEAVLGLREQQRQVVILRYYENLAPREIADRLGLPTTTVQSRLQRGLDQLRRDLDSAHAGDRRAWVASLGTLSGTFRAGSKGLALGTPVLLSRLHGLKLGAGVGSLVVAVVLGLGLNDADSGIPRSSATGRTEASTAGVVAAGTFPAVQTSPFEGHESPGAVSELDEGFRLRGRVVDDHRRAIGGIKVRLVDEFARTFVTETEADGAFEVIVPIDLPRETVELGLRCSGTEGAALARARLRRGGGREFDFGTLPLRHSGELRVRVVGPSGEGLAAHLVVRADDVPAPSFQEEQTCDILVGGFESNPDGELCLDGLPFGDFAIRASSGGFVGTAYAHLLSPRSEPITVQLFPERVVEVVAVDADLGTPVEGAEIVVRERRHERAIHTEFLADLPNGIPPTGSDGRTIISGLSRDVSYEVFSRVHWDDPSGLRFPRHALDAGVKSLRIPVAVKLSVMRDVRVGECGETPTENVQIQVRGYLERGFLDVPWRAGWKDGRLCLEDVDPRCRGALAIAGENCHALLDLRSSPNATPEPSKWYRPRTASIEVIDSDGRPSADVMVEVGFDNGAVRILEQVPTDASGRASLGGLPPASCDVFVTSLVSFGSLRRAVGSVDLRTSDGSHRIVLPSRTEVSLKVRIDGVERLPPTLTLLVPRGILGVIREDAASGALEFAVWPEREGAPFHVLGLARGIGAGDVLVTPTGRKTQATMDLAPIPPVLCRVHADPEVSFHLGLEFQRGASFGPISFNRRHAQRILGPDLVSFELVPAGRVRVVDAVSGARSRVFEIGDLPRSRELSIDLRGSGVRQGRVRLPPGLLAEETVIDVEDSLGSVVRSLSVRKDGTFSVGVSPHKSCDLVPRHPHAIPELASRRVDVRPSTDPIDLCFMPGSPLVVQTSPWVASARIGFFEPEVTRRVLWLTRPTSTDGLLRFSTPASPEAAVFLDCEGFVPSRLASVVGEAPSGVLPVELDPGASLRIRLSLLPGQPEPEISVHAISRFVPDHVRRGVRGGEREILVRGLGAGLYQVHVRSASSSLRSISEVFEIESDGVSAFEHALDLR